MKVIQAAGRIFRTSTDRGFVMLIGHRFNMSYYNSVLPSDWKIEQPPDLVKRIKIFWATQNSDTSGSKAIFKTADLLDFT